MSDTAVHLAEAGLVGLGLGAGLVLGAWAVRLLRAWMRDDDDERRHL